MEMEWTVTLPPGANRLSVLAEGQQSAAGRQLAVAGLTRDGFLQALAGGRAGTTLAVRGMCCEPNVTERGIIVKHEQATY